MKLPVRPGIDVVLPDGRRFRACGCIDVHGRAFLLCRTHHGGRPDLSTHHKRGTHV